MRGCDISNHNGFPVSYRTQGWYVSSEFVIVQAIEPPPGYPGYGYVDPETGKRGYTGEQLRAAREDGKKVGIYVWLWSGLADTQSNILGRLQTVPSSVPLDMRPWLDIEDNTANTTRQRQKDILDARATMDEWASQMGLPQSGGYSADWYVKDYLDGWWPDNFVKWWANYSAPAGSIIGGDVVAHQYTSSPADLNEMLESEIIQVTGTPTAADCQVYKDAIERAVNRLQIELDRKDSHARPAELRRSIIEEIQRELFAAFQA
jgi:hypothetical protein